MSHLEVFTPAEVSRMATMLLDLGLHPSVVRRRLAEKGIRWQYQFRAPSGVAQGMKQRVRNLKHEGLGLCPSCGEKAYVLTSTVSLCGDCLAAKWTRKAEPPIACQSIGSPTVPISRVV